MTFLFRAYGVDLIGIGYNYGYVYVSLPFLILVLGAWVIVQRCCKKEGK